VATEWGPVFERIFTAPMSRVDQRIMREVYGDEYPAEVDPYSYVSRTELRRCAIETSVAAADGGLLVDIGCGRGGPGLWVATQIDARLIGVDLASSAASAAADRAAQLGLDRAATFIAGSFDGVPLATAAVDAVMSVDALLFAPDKAVAVAELARVLRPGGRLVVTTWDYRSQPLGRPPQVDDHRPLLAAAGLDVLAYEETDDWSERIRRTDELTLGAVDELAAEAGVDVEELRTDLESDRATFDTILRRVLVVAERR